MTLLRHAEWAIRTAGRQSTCRHPPINRGLSVGRAEPPDGSSVRAQSSMKPPSVMLGETGRMLAGNWSWGYFIAFASRENLDPAGPGTGGYRQIFRFDLLNYACQKGQPNLRSPDETTPPCPATPQPYIKQVTSGPGDADNPSVSSDGRIVAFEADGAYNGGGGFTLQLFYGLNSSDADVVADSAQVDAPPTD